MYFGIYTAVKMMQLCSFILKIYGVILISLLSLGVIILIANDKEKPPEYILRAMDSSPRKRKAREKRKISK